MKKFLATSVAVLCFFGLASAQDLEKASEIYNQAAGAIETNKTEAITLFQQALEMASALGEEGNEITTQCKDIIPKLFVSVGKELASAKDMDGAIAQLQKAIDFGESESATEAKELIPQLLMSNAGSLLNAKQYAEAAAAYKKVVDADPENGMAFLRMGMALSSNGDIDAAIEALTSAVSKGQAEAAGKQLANVYLKQAVACQKTKDMKGVLENAQKSAEFGNSANAQKLIGTAALELKQNKVAADAFESYLAISPDAKDKVQIIFQLGTALMNAGDNSKACGYFKEIAQDAKFGESARYYLTTLKCQ